MYTKHLLLYVSLFALTSHGFVYDKDNWRSVANAVLSGSSTENTGDSYNTVDKCKQECISQDSCLSFAFNTNDNVCYIYTGRFGFDSLELQLRSNTIYYEKPIGYSTYDNVGTYLDKTYTRDGSYYKYKGRFRNGINGLLLINDKLSNRNQISIEYTSINNDEECAAKCLRNGADMGNGYAKCVSFNYNPLSKSCILYSFGLDNNHVLRINNNKGYLFYDKIAGLEGSGCWITQSKCKKANTTTAYDGHFEHTKMLSIANGDAYDIDGKILWESDCVEMAQWWHEDVCQNDVDVPTIAYWTGDGLNPTYIDWNSWDTSSGCVIDIPQTCISGNSRFHVNTPFRDSIGEEYFASATSADKCFSRANEYHSYVCNGNKDTTIRLDYPSTGQYYIFPSPDCECENSTVGYMKIDSESNEMKYCRRANLDAQCYRINQGNYWPKAYTDILCSDTKSGCSTPSNTSSDAGCYYFRSTIDDNAGPCRSGNTPSFGNNILEILIPGITTESECIAKAESQFLSCNNDVTNIDNQIKTWWKPTGKTSVFPDFDQPYTTTLIRGINTDAKFVVNDPDRKIISLMPIRTGRWMAFTATSSAFLRAISVWINTPYAVDLTLTLYKGRGITDVEELTSVTQNVAKTTKDIHSELYNRGAFVTFNFANTNIWMINSGVVYTWEITIVQNTGGEEISIGYDIGNNNYGGGRGDLRWDYLFITWIEDLQNKGSLAGLEAPQITKRPWFETWFVIGLVIWFLFLVFLLCLHWQRKRQEKKDKEEDRLFQRELKERIRKQAQEQQLAKQMKKKKKKNKHNDDDYEKKYDSDSNNSDHNVAPSTRVPTDDVDDDMGRTENIAGGKKSKKKGLKVKKGRNKASEFERVPSAMNTPLPE